MGGIDRLVVVGGSLGAARVVEEARRIGFAGSIVVIGREHHVPYDRPPLTKEFLTAETEPELVAHLPDPEALAVTLMTGTAALSLDTRNRLVRTERGEVGYDALVIATGGQPRPLEVPGGDLPGVTTLRSVEQARTVRAALEPGARVVVVGAGFVGCEIASSARARGADVTVVEALPLPLANAVGPLVAERLAYLHRQYGVDLRTRTKVREITGNGAVEKVRLNDGSVVPADLVVVGIGVDPTTGWLRGSGVAVSDGVACSPYLESTVPGVYAVGDVARWVNQWNGRSSRLEHWTSTGEQAVAVVRNALTDDRSPCGIVPYFWSEWYGHKLQLLGEPADEVELLGDAGGASDPFLAQYRYDGDLAGAFAFDRTGPLMKLRAAVRKRTSWQAMLGKPAQPGAGLIGT
ncbi:NAD(P)/FAD-dependent oxidoreductase [Amycolatopsis benzoatilytica]|uniref:NAD(P)/FAD-dependent oxidoreductase n=1 Tax=Amycolatopsis benzoatilytica TaxID=346045 RepID=UPI000379E469|nr:FAD-dependent oxidoreductase [Amycolatopsis benzoatilytica]